MRDLTNIDLTKNLPSIFKSACLSLLSFGNVTILDDLFVVTFMSGGLIVVRVELGRSLAAPEIC